MKEVGFKIPRPPLPKGEPEGSKLVDFVAEEDGAVRHNPLCSNSSLRRKPESREVVTACHCVIPAPVLDLIQDSPEMTKTVFTDVLTSSSRFKRHKIF
jgi:hypothetical protein